MVRPSPLIRLLLGVLLGAASLPALAEESPAALVRGEVDQVLRIVQDRSVSDATRRERLRERIGRSFDFEAMSQSILATHWDVGRRRIPNWLTFPSMALALAAHATAAGLGGAGFALAGIAAGFAVLVLPYAAGFLGAGDVKASMAIGALLGASGVLAVLVWSAFLGGVLGAALLFASGGFGELLRRWATALGLSLATRRFVYLPPPPDAPAARALPFGPVLAAGVAAAFAWGTPWA